MKLSKSVHAKFVLKFLRIAKMLAKVRRWLDFIAVLCIVHCCQSL